jgi:hypothetical protein
MVGSAMAWCHMLAGSWLVMMVARSPARSSITSSRSAAWSGGERADEQVIDDQDADAGPGGQQPGEPSVAAGDGQVVEHPRGAQVQRGVAGADGGVREGAGQVGLPAAGRYPRFRLVKATFLQVMSMLRLM